MTAADPAPQEELEIRPRTAADLPALIEVLAAQQPTSGYPFRWPLPFPVEDFIVRAYEERAWVATLGGRPVGHVMAGSVDAGLARLCAATGATSFASMSVLFVDERVRGTGIGVRLMETAVEWIREQGRLPILDVLPRHGPAVALYRHRGWQEVARVRPEWLPADQDDVIVMALPR